MIYTVNAKGRVAILDYISDQARMEIDPCNDAGRADAWIADAERAANDSWPTYDASIEIGSQYTRDGNPVVLLLDRAWSDAQ